MQKLIKICAWSCALVLAACNAGKEKDDRATGTDTTNTGPDTAANVEETHAMALVPNKDRYFYQPDTSIITGKITLEMFYGPPGYGENPEEDAKEEIYFLWPERAVKVFSNSPEQEEESFDLTQQNVDRVQVFSAGDIDFKQLEGKTVQVRGVFFGAHTGHHHADVIMDVVELRVIE